MSKITVLPPIGEQPPVLVRARVAGVDDSLVDRVVRGVALVAGGPLCSRLVLGLGVAGVVVAVVVAGCSR